MLRTAPPPDKWPANAGLARAAAISGDRKQAVAYARQVLAQGPDDANRRTREVLIRQWSAPAKP